MTFDQILSLTKFIMNFNDGQSDQDFSEVRIKELINLAYVEEVNKAKQEGVKRYFKAFHEETWTSGNVTFTLPSTVSRAELIEARDVTSDTIGTLLAFSDSGVTGIGWKDRNTLQWGLTGPDSDRTIRFVYYAQPETLVAEDDEPELIPPQFHAVLAWGAACYGRTIADEQVPQSWAYKLEDLRHDYWKFISRGRPISAADGGAGISSDFDSGTTDQDGSSINQGSDS